MKLRVKFELNGLAVDDMVEGETSQDIVKQAKSVVSARLGFLAGAVVRAMSDLDFSREVVRRYNKATGSSSPLPETLDDFVEWTVSEELATVVEPA